MLRVALFFSLFLLSVSPVQAQVVVSIKPLHSLVAGVMEGSGMSPAVLVSGNTSLHDFSLKPSQAKTLHAARVVFYMGDTFEQFLPKILSQLPVSTQRIPLEHSKNMTLYPLRNASSGVDLHAWLSPANARAMVAEIARVLSETYPEHAALFAANAKKIDAKLILLDADLRMRMGKLTGKPFAVFHDATQYFDRAYGLKNIGVIALHPEHGLTAKRVSELREKIKASGAACVFREPEFEGKIVENLVQGTHAKSGLIDPEATLLAPGAELYVQMMEQMALALEKCLS